MNVVKNKTGLTSKIFQTKNEYTRKLLYITRKIQKYHATKNLDTINTKVTRELTQKLLAETN